jgi:hypothetical protein
MLAAPGDAATLSGGLLLTRMLVKNFEFRESAARQQLDAVVASLFPALFERFGELLNAPRSEEAGYCVKLAAATLHSACLPLVPRALYVVWSLPGWCFRCRPLERSVAGSHSHARTHAPLCRLLLTDFCPCCLLALPG